MSNVVGWQIIVLKFYSLDEKHDSTERKKYQCIEMPSEMQNN